MEIFPEDWFAKFRENKTTAEITMYTYNIIGLILCSEENSISDTPTSAWEEVIAVFVEWYSHDPVCEVECFLNTISVMDVYINVQHSGMVSDGDGIESGATDRNTNLN